MTVHNIRENKYVCSENGFIHFHFADISPTTVLFNKIT